MSKALLRKTAVGIVIGLCARPVPGYSATFLTFSNTVNSPIGSITVNGNSQNSSETIASLSGIVYDRLVIFGAPASADNGTWTLTGSNLAYNTSTQLLTLNGTFGTCSGCIGTSNLGGLTTTLESIHLTGLPYNTGAGSGFTTAPNSQTINVVFGTPTSLTESATFLSDLGLGIVTSTLTAGDIGGTGTGIPSGGVYSYRGTSETLSVTLTATPEPVSIFLVATGLLGMAFVRRRRSIQI